MTSNIVLLEQPRRPLSAYNYFFRAERAKMLGMKEIEERDPSEKRKHRKVHGKIGFRDMASHIGARWKSLSNEEREPFTKQFQEDRARYKKEMKEWNDRMKQKGTKKSGTVAVGETASTIEKPSSKAIASKKSNQNKKSKTSFEKKGSSDTSKPKTKPRQAIPLPSPVQADTPSSSSMTSSASFVENVLSGSDTPSLSTMVATNERQHQKIEECAMQPKISVHDSIDISLQMIENDLMGMGSATGAGGRGRKRTHMDLMSNEELDQHLTAFLIEQQETLNDDLPESCMLGENMKLPSTNDEADFDAFLKAFDFSDDEESDDGSDSEEPSMASMMSSSIAPMPVATRSNMPQHFAGKPPSFLMAATSRPSWMTSMASARPSFVSAAAANAHSSNMSSSVFPWNNNCYNFGTQRSRSSPSAVSFMGGGRTNSVAAAALTPQQLHQARQMASELERLQVNLTPAAAAAHASAASLFQSKPSYEGAAAAIPISRPSSSESSADSSRVSIKSKERTLNKKATSALRKKAPTARAPLPKAEDLWGQAMMGYEPPSPVTVTSAQISSQQEKAPATTEQVRDTVALLRKESKHHYVTDIDLKGDLMKSIESLQVSFREEDHDDLKKATQSSDFWNSNMTLLDPFDTSSHSFDCSSDRLLSA